MKRTIIVYATLCLFAVASLTAPSFANSDTSSAFAEPSKEAGVDGSTDEPRSKGFFMVALVPILADLVGKIGGNIIDALFFKKPGAPPNAAAIAAPKPRVSIEQLSIDGKYYAGLAYTTYVVTTTENDEAKMVSSARRIDAETYRFHTGDRFFVSYAANMPGRLNVSNVNSEGREKVLGTWPVIAGETGRKVPQIGAFRFTGTTGDEELRFGFTPCTSGSQSKDIDLDATAVVDYGKILPACEQYAATSKDIIVDTKDGVSYAVAQLESDEFKSNAPRNRVFKIHFHHIASDGAAKDWVISPEDLAKAPTLTAKELVLEKSDPDGPEIEVRVPGEIKEVSPPVPIDIVFKPKDGRKIDFKSLKVTVPKYGALGNITSKISRYLTTTGIYTSNAQIPPGDWLIEMSIKDDAGRRTVEHFGFKVLGK